MSARKRCFFHNKVMLVGSNKQQMTNTDCDDTHASFHPGAAEICDGLETIATVKLMKV